MSLIPEVVLVSEALGKLAGFFIERFDQQAERYNEDAAAFRQETIDQLERQAETNTTLRENLRGTANAIEELVKLRLIVEDIEDAEEIDDVKSFYQEYCKNLIFLRNVGLDYRTMVRNFELKSDYRSELGLQLFDYDSDLALVGLLFLEETEDLLVDEDDLLDFESVRTGVAIATQVNNFIEAALRLAVNGTEDWRGTHVDYVKKLQYHFDYRFVRLLEWIGNLALQRGYCGAAARFFKNAKQVEERLEETEQDWELKKYHGNQKQLMEMFVDKAIAFAWLERLKSRLGKLVATLTPTDFKSRAFASIKDRFGTPESYSLDRVRKDAKEELGYINSMCKSFAILLDDESEPLPLPNIEELGQDFSLPSFDYEPAPL